MEDKRKRNQNFTNDEKSVLTNLVIKYRDLVENKKSDATTNSKKALGWKRLCEEFNAVSSYCIRNPESLKTCWENLKRQAKKQSASQKRELFKTGGGGPAPPPPGTGADHMIEVILGPALEGLENPYDCDFIEADLNNKENEVEIFTSSETHLPGVISEIPDSEPSCSYTLPIASASLENKNHDTEQESSSQNQGFQIDEENDNLKWEGWTPKSLKRPISEVLKENNSWLKRRMPEQNLSDQLIQEKINLVKTLINNAQEESKKRMLILDEQLKQEKIKTQKLLES